MKIPSDISHVRAISRRVKRSNFYRSYSTPIIFRSSIIFREIMVTTFSVEANQSTVQTNVARRLIRESGFIKGTTPLGLRFCSFQLHPSVRVLFTPICISFARFRLPIFHVPEWTDQCVIFRIERTDPRRENITGTRGLKFRSITRLQRFRKFAMDEI